MLTIGLCFGRSDGRAGSSGGWHCGGWHRRAFALDKMQMGWIFSAGILGLLPGALVGGMLADRYGRKRILIGSVALFGLFSLATAICTGFPLTGLCAADDRCRAGGGVAESYRPDV